MHPRKDSVQDFARGTIQLRVGGNDYTAQVVVAERSNGKLLLYDILDLIPTSIQSKKPDTAIAKDPSPGTDRRTVPNFENSIPESSQDVNPQQIQKRSSPIVDSSSAKGGDDGLSLPEAGPGSGPETRYSFGGKNAQQADSASLAMAEDMERQGRDAETIRRETGWFRSMDGQWRFEIDDSGMEYAWRGDLGFRERNGAYDRYRQLNDQAERSMLGLSDQELTDAEWQELRALQGTWGKTFQQAGRISADALPTSRLSDYVRHEELYRNYPQLRDAGLRFAAMDGTENGRYDPRSNVITINEDLRYAPEDTLIHEVQHAIQEAEGFAKGSSPEYWADQGADGMTPMERYRNTAGEIEARDAEHRRTMTAEERRQTAPDLGDENTVSAGGADRSASIGYDQDNRPFVTVEEDILEGVPREDWVRTVKDNLRKKFPNGVTVGNNQIKINRQSRQEMTYSRYMQRLFNTDPVRYADKLRATNNADEILKSAQDWINEPPLHKRADDISDFSRGDIQLRIGNRDYVAEVVVGNRGENGLILYDIINLSPTTILERTEKAGTAYTANTQKESRSRGPVPADDSIPQSGQEVKPR